MPEGFDNIDYANKAVAVPLPDRINDISYLHQIMAH